MGLYLNTEYAVHLEFVNVTQQWSSNYKHKLKSFFCTFGICVIFPEKPLLGVDD